MLSRFASTNARQSWKLSWLNMLAYRKLLSSGSLLASLAASFLLRDRHTSDYCTETLVRVSEAYTGAYHRYTVHFFMGHLYPFYPLKPVP